MCIIVQWYCSWCSKDIYYLFMGEIDWFTPTIDGARRTLNFYNSIMITPPSNSQMMLQRRYMLLFFAITIYSIVEPFFPIHSVQCTIHSLFSFTKSNHFLHHFRVLIWFRILLSECETVVNTYMCAHCTLRVITMLAA